MQGLNEVTVKEAERSAKALVQELGISQEYRPLQELLRNRRPTDVVQTACALAVVVQPFKTEPAAI